MKKEDSLKDNFTNMKSEYEVCHHKTCRKIDAIFVDEIKHFKNLLVNFNKEHSCFDEDKVNEVVEKLKEIFNSSKIVLMENYISRFDENVDELTATMYDFYLRRLSNLHAKSPGKDMNRCLMDMCKFDTFLFQDKLENELIDFSNDFIYRYVNCEDASRDFLHLLKNVEHGLICEIKKAIADSIQDKQDITMRYNTLNKEVLNSVEPRR